MHDFRLGDAGTGDRSHVRANPKRSGRPSVPLADDQSGSEDGSDDSAMGAVGMSSACDTERLALSGHVYSYAPCRTLQAYAPRHVCMLIFLQQHR